MRTIPWPELITPTAGATIGAGGPDGGAFIPPPAGIEEAELSMEAMAIGLMFQTQQGGASMEGMGAGLIYQTAGQDAPSMEGFAIGVIFQEA